MKQSQELVERLNNHPYIRAKKHDNGITAYNFTHQAFFENHWDETTVNARGLFMDGANIVGRGYNKFFNLNQHPGFTEGEVLEQFEYPVTVSQKLNGFLAIAFVYNGELMVWSKSGESVFAQEARRILVSELGENINSFIYHLDSAGVSATFEIISDKDFHIVKEGKERVVLLDLIANTEDFVPLSKNVVEKFGKHFGVEVASNTIVNTSEELKKALDDSKNSLKEGAVFRDSKGRMTKVKSDYYLAVKTLRTPINRMLKGKELKRNNEIMDIIVQRGFDPHDYLRDGLLGKEVDLPSVAENYNVADILKSL